MAYDEKLAQRSRGIFRELCRSESTEIAEKKMFGGLAFMVNGNMCCGVQKSRLMVRVGADAYGSALARKHAAPMDFTGKPLKGFVYVASEGVGTKKALRDWMCAGSISR